MNTNTKEEVRELSGASKRIVVTGGRSPAALEITRLLHAAGHTVFAAESWERHLCRASRSVAASFKLPAPRHDPEGYAEALRRVIVQCNADVLLPTCEEIYTIARYKELLSEHCYVFTEPLAVLSQLHHKGKFIERASSFGLPVPQTRLAENPEQLLRLAGDRELFPHGAVMKPAYSRFASKVMVIPSDRQLDLQKVLSAVNSVSAQYPWVVQNYLPGRQLCTYSIAHQGVITAHTAYRTKHTAGQGASVQFEHEADRESFAWVETFVKKLGFSGQIAFDFKEDHEGRLLPLECNPRTTSGIHLLAGVRGLDRVFLQSERCSDGTPLTPSSGSPAMLGAAMLLTGWSGKHTWGEWQEWASDWARSRDVLFRRDDPMPALEQLRVLGRLTKERLRSKLSLIELTTSDIEWNGEA